MASRKCLICTSSFSGRKDAKTCSARCRKRLQKVRLSIAAPARRRLTKAVVSLAAALIGILFILIGPSSTPASAAASSYLNFQARLLSSSGNIVPDGNYNVEFKLYNTSAPGGGHTEDQGACTYNGGTSDPNCLWVETRTGANQVRVVDGYLTVNLGSVNAFPSTISWDQQLWLTMNVGGIGGTPSWDGEMSPRILLTKLPSAFTADQLATTNGNRGTLKFASLGQATDITLPDPGATTATVCYQSASACGFAPGTSGSYIQNGTSVQTANFNVQSSAVGSIGAVIAGASGQTADILDVNANGGANPLFSIGNTGNATFRVASGQDSTTAFQIQNAAGAQALNINTTTSNLVSNGSFEVNTTGWAAKGSATLSQSSTRMYIGNDSLAIATTAAANDGAKYAVSLTSNNEYALSLYARTDSKTSMSTFEIGYSNDGATDTSCLTAQTVSGSGWTRYTCTFNTGTTSGSPYIYVKQTDATARTIYIDAVQLTQFSLLANPSIEQSITGNWTFKGGATVSQTSAQKYDGNNSLQVVTTATAGDGAKQNITLNDSTRYVLTFADLLDSGSGTSASVIEAGYSSDGVTDNTVCITSTNISATGWRYYSCSFVTPASHSGTPYFYIKQTAATAYTFYIDAVQLTAGSPAPAYSEGQIAINPLITSPLSLQNQSDSKTALQIQNAEGQQQLAFDTTNGALSITRTGICVISCSSAPAAITLNTTQPGDVADFLKAIGPTGTPRAEIDANGIVYARESTTSTVTIGSGGVPTVQLGVGANQSSVTSPADGQVQINGHNTTSQLIVQGQAGQTSDYFDLIPNGTSNPLFSVGNAGALLSKNSTNSTTAFQVQNALGSNALRVDTTPLNSILINSSFESSDISAWTYLGTPGSVTRDTSQSYIGLASLNVTTTANASNGVKYVTGSGASALAVSSTYTISWYDKLSSGTFTDVRAVYARDGATEVACSGINTQTVLTTGWTRHTCQIVTDATAPAASAYIAIEQTAGTARTFWVDAVQIEAGTTATTYRETAISLAGRITSPIALQNAADSTTAFQIQNAAGTSNLLVADTVDSEIGINKTPSAGVALDVNGIISSSNTVEVGTRLLLNNSTNSAGYISKWTTVGSTGANTDDVVIYTTDGGAAKAITTTTPRDPRVYGVVISAVAPNTNTAVAISGHVPVNVDSAAVNIGDQLVTSSTAGEATVDNNATTGILGYATTSKAFGSSGTVDVYLRPVSGQYTPTFRSNSSSATAFQIQNASGAQVLNVDTTATANLITNGGFESGATGWAAKGSASAPTQDSTQQWQGNYSLNVTTTAAAGDGVKYNYTFTNGQQYTLSFYAKVASGSITDINFGRQDDGATDTDCLTGQTLTTSWTRYVCTFTAGAQSGTPNLYIKKTNNTTAETFYIDGVQLQTGPNATAFNAGGALQFGGIVNSPIALQNKSDSTTAFQIQNAAGTSNLLVADTTNSRIGIGVAAPAATLDISGTANTASTNVVRISGTSNTTTLNAQQYGLSSSLTASPTSASTSIFSGLYGNAISSTANTSGAVLYGGNFQAAALNGGNVGTAAGVNISNIAANLGGGAATINNNYGVIVNNPSNVSSTITNNTGISIDNQSGGTNNTNLLIGTKTIPTGNYSIYNSSSNANYFAGNIGIASAPNGAPIYINKNLGTLSSGGSAGYGINNLIQVTGSADGSSTVTGTASNITLQGGNSNSWISGANLYVNNNSTSSTATPIATGLYSQLVNGGSNTITTANGLDSFALLSGSGNITTYSGLSIDRPTVSGTGTIGTDYGINIHPQAGSAVSGTAYGVYQSGSSDLNYFAGGTTIQGSTILSGGVNRLSVPQVSSLTAHGTLGTTEYCYEFTAVNAYGGETAAFGAACVSNGNATLSGTNYIQISWTAVTGAVSYKVYRSFVGSGGSPSSTGLIGTTTSTSLNDTGLAASGGLAPSVDTTGQLTVQGATLLQNTTNSTQAFQIQNASGNAALLNADTTNARVGINNTYAAMFTPVSLAVGSATSGGSLTASATYRYKVTAIDSAGGETAASSEASGATTSSNLTLPVTWSTVYDASGYKVYRTAANGAAGSEVYLTTVLTNSFTDTGTITAGTAAPPTTTTAYYSTNNSNSSLQLSVGGNGTPTGQVYVSGTLPTDVTAGGVATTTKPDAVYVQGRYAYVASANGASSKLQIFDVANPVKPVDVSNGGVSMASGTADLFAQGHYVYVATSNGKLQIFNVSNPASPVDITSGGVAAGVDPNSIYVQGRYAYIADWLGNQLEIFDVSNPATPQNISNISTGVGHPLGVFVQGRYAYTVSQNTNKLQIFDVSNPANPVDVSSGGVTTANVPNSVYVQGRYAYVLAQAANKLQIFDVSNPSSPVDVTSGGVATGSAPYAIYVQGRYAYITDNSGNKLQVFDVSNPTKPVDVSGGGVATGTDPNGLYVSGRYAYVGNFGSNTMQIFDLGGEYAQQLEAGGAEVGTLQVDSNGQVAGDFNIQGGLSVGQSLQAAGSLGIQGGAYVQGSTVLAGGNNLLGPPSGTPAVSFSGTVGGSAVTWSYVVTAVNAYGGESTASATGSITAPASSNSTLSSTNYNTISWSAVTGATSYKIYRTAATGGTPSTTGYIGSTSGTSFSDTGVTGAGNTAPTTDTTGQLTVQGSALFKNTTNSTTALQVQNASGSIVLDADTTNARVGIGTSAPSDTLEVVGNIVSKGTSWTAHTPPASNFWTSVAYGNGRFVAVGQASTGNRVMTSPDGINWTLRNSAADNDWISVTYGNGLFVAVSYDGTSRVMTSPDGINWTARTAAASNTWESVTYGNGLFVAVANSGTGNRVMTSPDGVNWTSRTSAADDAWLSVTYGNGLFVAVSGDGHVMTSPDGITWTLRTAAAGNLWADVTYGNGLFVAVGQSGSGNRVMTSPDGVTWTSRASAADNLWTSVTYGNGLFVAVAGNGTNRVMTSPDGINWVTRPTPLGAWNSITYGNGTFAAVADSGGASTMTSGREEATPFSANNTYQGGVTVHGNSTFQSDANSTTAFQVQNASGTPLFTADTVNTNISIRDSSSNFASTGSELISGTTCSGTNWSGSGTGPYTYSGLGGDALSCSPPASVTAGAIYQVVYSISGNTNGGTITPSVGGQNGIDTSSGETQLITASTTAGLTFTPGGSNFNGQLTVSSLRQVIVQKSVLTIQNGSGNADLEFRTGSSNQNTFVGLSAGQANTFGQANTGFGYLSLQSNTQGTSNTAIGSRVLQANTLGNYNTALGDSALLSNVSGSQNVAIGYTALQQATDASYNIAVGSGALSSVQSNNNVAVGQQALGSSVAGGNNTALGYYAGINNVGGSNNTFLGYSSGNSDGTFATASNLQNATAIGNNSQVQSSNSLILGGAGANAVNVGIGTTSPTNLFSVSPDIYDTGTASVTSGTTAVSGSGTAWTSSMAGMEFIFSDGTKYTIASVGSGTSLTLSSNASTTESGSNYRIHNPAFYVSSTGSTQIRTSTNSTTAFQVQNASGSTLFGLNTASLNATFTGAQGTSIVTVKDNGNGGTLTLGTGASGGTNITFGNNGFIGGASNQFQIKGTGTIPIALYTNSVQRGTIDQNGLFTYNGQILAANATNSTTAFQVQNAVGSSALLVDTTSLNSFLTNSNFENSSVSTWTYSGAAGGSVARSTSQHYQGTASLSVTTGTTAAAFDGVKSTLNSTLAASTTYTISWYDTISSGSFSDVIAQFSYDGTTTNASSCTGINTQTVSTNGWTRHSCQFTTGSAGTAPTSSNAIFIVQQGSNGGVQRTFYVDAVQVEQASSATAYKENGLQLNGVVASSLVLQNATNSTTAFDVKDANANDFLKVDTTNGAVSVGITGSTNVNSTVHIADSSAGVQTVTVGSTSSSSATTIQGGTGNINLLANGSSNTGTTVTTSNNSTAAFQIQQASGGTVLLAADTSNLVITISGNTTNFANLTLTNAHFKSTQTTAPTIGTPTNCGTSPSAAVTAGSTDSAGSFTITAGSGSPTSCDTVVTFNKAYGAAPKAVLLMPTLAVGSANGTSSVVVNVTSTSSFSIYLQNSFPSTVFSYYYWVIE